MRAHETVMTSSKTKTRAGAGRKTGGANKSAAFIGLGDMGLPMAHNLLRAGYAVAGYDLSARRRGLLKTAGGRAACCSKCAV